jgi:Raf kinase inhibitor-like YbhB/YbcL family protein
MRSRSVLVLFALAGACGSEDTESLTLPAPKGGEYGPAMTLESDAFADGADMPERFTCDGDGLAPPLAWSNVPDGTDSFALVADDPDAPRRVWVHWVAWAIPADERMLLEGTDPEVDEFVQGRNDDGEVGWTGPCPPSDHDAHRFEFHVFAVDFVPDLPITTTRDELYRALDGRVLAMGELAGLYDR